jgi:hypothetical protein
MGLAASQARYLTLTARKSDLEYQAQTISSRRLQLAYKTAEIAREYANGMNNKCIMIARNIKSSDGTFSPSWEELNFSNLLENSMVLWGTDGYPVKRPSTDVDAQQPYIVERYFADGKTAAGSSSGSAVFSTTPLPETYTENGEEKKYVYKYIQNPKYMENLAGGNDIQSLLVSGVAHCVSKDFALFLMKHLNAEGNGYLYTDENGNQSVKTYNEMQEIWSNENTGALTDIDWRSDITGRMEQKYYTQDDEAALARYEQETAAVQAQDKMLELEIKNIETQHKAVETELESVQKVIQNNIEKTFKIFS